MDNLEYPDTDAAGYEFEKELDDRYYEIQKRATLAAERQAAAMERIATVFESVYVKDVG
jgi:hypothetical protein